MQPEQDRYLKLTTLFTTLHLATSLTAPTATTVIQLSQVRLRMCTRTISQKAAIHHTTTATIAIRTGLHLRQYSSTQTAAAQTLQMQA
jgi:uridylate kinase